ncbi:MAG: transketolase C-terminal domain-containing protein [Paraburkholderia tropica]|uniref:Transketolase subunit B n=1 Tax=Paraburkholderia tropica TaxID=92647 RepID=A0ABX5MUB9_9BURK|nr:transketolase C-terminal domain-containing protein [Paraburkholderia tropica]MDE1144750.1 transketolase C-terminal domain-containing protein [Paraburkholderia tropica]PXX15898.1 transketolase subunit B [Paraburkholderia tropica]PZW82157.1 transketolase subunit B [Paraburkholderia tropica]
MRNSADLRDGAVSALSRLTAAGEDIIVMVADSTSTSKIGPFLETYPERVVNVGIAEQNMVGMAAGLALGGHIVFTANAAPFLVGRANEQVKNDICYSATNVKMLGLNAGVAYGPLASTHHAIDDISIMSGFGNVQIFAPCDEAEVVQMIDYAAAVDGPVYIRLDNAKFPVVHDASYRFQPGRPDVLIEGRGVAVIALGSVVGEALEACERLQQQGVHPTLVNLSSLRPLDQDALATIIERHDAIVTVEEHSLHGGIGAMVAMLMARRQIPRRLTTLGVTEGEFAQYGTRKGIRRHYGIDADGIAEAIQAQSAR